MHPIAQIPGYLTRIELQKTIGDVLFQDLSMDHIETLYTEFDKNEDGKIDFPEFKEMHRYIKEAKRKKRGSAKLVSYHVVIANSWRHSLHQTCVVLS